MLESLLPYIPAEFSFFTFIIFLFFPVALSTKIPTVLLTSKSIFPLEASFITIPALSPALFFKYIAADSSWPTIISFSFCKVVVPVAVLLISTYIPADAVLPVPFNSIFPVFAIVLETASEIFAKIPADLLLSILIVPAFEGNESSA